MACPECGSATISFSVPDEYREYLSVDEATVAFCTRCLTLSRDPGGKGERKEEEPDFAQISDAFPTRPGAAIPLAIALDLAASLATNRSAIESLLQDVERAGTDPLLVIDRLTADPTVESATDLERRQHQLEQLLY